MDIHVRQQRLPGIGHRYELTLSDDQDLVVIAHTDGVRDLTVTPSGSTEPETFLSLDQSQAATVAALLIGATFSVDTTQDDTTPADEVIVQTITLGPASPVLGRTVADIDLPGDAEAVVLAIIRDDTPELIEDPATRTCQPGDRLVIAANRDHIHAITRLLARAKI
jgi:TrkA domain protein